MTKKCGHERGIAEDLLGRGMWTCTLEPGHDGPHYRTLGSDWCRWDDDGLVPEEDL